MMSVRHKIEAIMTADGQDRWSLPAAFLQVISRVYGGAVALRASFYRIGLLRRRRLPCRVISIGNLTMGGTGKTPMTVYVAELLGRMGCRPAVVSRGYRGRWEKKGGVVSDGRRLLATAAEAGDEAFMMARNLPHVPILVGRDRFRSGRLAVSAFHADVVILDDGFQHLRLKRDVDLVLLDGRKPLGNGHLFPRGLLREPLSALKRADACVLTRCRRGAGRQPAAGRGPFFRTGHQPYLARVVPAGRIGARDDGAVEDDFESLRGRRAVAFSGIARNDEFKRMLLALGCDLAGFAGFADHHWYTADDVRTLMDQVRQTGAGLVITTDKDYARIHDQVKWPVDLAVVGIKISLMGQADGFARFLETRLAKAGHGQIPGNDNRKH